MDKPRVLKPSYPSVLTLPLEVKAMKCANGETVEWRLLVGDALVTTVWLTGVSEGDAVRHLLAKAAQNG